MVGVLDRNEKWVHANKLKTHVACTDAIGIIFNEDAEFGKVNTVPVPMRCDWDDRAIVGR